MKNREKKHSEFDKDNVDVVLKSMKMSHNKDSIPIEYLGYVKTAFELSHKLVNLQDNLNYEAGTLFSFFRNLFRKVDYDYYYLNAKEIYEGCLLHVKKVHSMCNVYDNDLTAALCDYSDALLAISDLFVREAEFCAKKSISFKTMRTSYSEFRHIIRGEAELLAKCQVKGDKLTTIYRAILLNNLKDSKDSDNN